MRIEANTVAEYYNNIPEDRKIPLTFTTWACMRTLIC